MYQIKCDDFILFDPREEDLIVLNPKCAIAVNTVGESAFTIYSNHPYYDRLKLMKSVFELSDEYGVFFRGRMTENTRDFDKGKAVDLEGALAYFNDSVVRPFNFPEDFLEDADYIESAENGNVVGFFLNWLIENHNSQVQPFQRLKLGNVTVADKNNYITRSDSAYKSTWETVKSKLFESALGGYLCIRYEADGNYVDYLAKFEETNEQVIKFGENLLNLSDKTEGGATYTAAIPIGAKIDSSDDEGNTTSHTVTLNDLADMDGEITLDIVKAGDTIYSKSGVDAYGWIYAPISDTTWDDVKEPQNLLDKSVEWLSKTGIMLTNTIEATAVDLHFSDDDVRSLRIYKNVVVESEPHGLSAVYPLTKLEIYLAQPQNTKITAGDTVQTLTEKASESAKQYEGSIIRIESDLKQQSGEVKQLNEAFASQIEQLAKSITLEVSGSLGDKANIVLSVGGVTQKTELELSKVRQAFANDNSAVEISAGTITFNSGTLIVNSDNFSLSADGTITANAGKVGGWTLKNYKLYAGDGATIKTVCVQAPTENNLYVFAAGGTSHDSYADCPFRVTKAGKLYATDAIIHGDLITIDGSYKTQMDKGSLRLYYADKLCGTINTKYWSGASTEGISLRIEEAGNYIMFSHPSDAGTGYDVDYYLNYGWSSNYDEKHIFQTSARFLSDVYLDGKTDIGQLVLRGPGGKRYLVTAYDGVLECSEI